MKPNIQNDGGPAAEKIRTLFVRRAMQGGHSSPPAPQVNVPKDNAMASGIGALLRGAEAGSLTPAEEADARSQIEQMGPGILSAAENSTDPRHALAHKVLQSFIAFAGGAS